MVSATDVSAQRREAKRGMLGMLSRMSSWNVDVNGGLGDYGRFLLQHPTRDLDDFRQRELTTSMSYSVGLGVGATVLPRVGFRLGYNYTWSDLDWRDDSGDGSTILDFDDVGKLHHHIASLEVIRYLLPEKMKFTPFASAGVLATWWNLGDTDLSSIFAPGGSTQFAWGGTGTVGLQGRFGDHWRVRLEAATATIGNPFNGRESFVSVVGRVIDEPDRIRKTDFRLGVAYTWGSVIPTPATNR